MFKKRIWVPVLIALAWVSTLTGLVVLMSFINIKRDGVVCKDVKVIIPGNQYFIEKQEVDNILLLGGNGLIGRKLSQINIHELENKLKANAFIEAARVYADMDGVIIVEISQRQPLLRIINKEGQDFYIDQHALKVPLSPNFTAKVLVANGNIEEGFANRVDTLTTTTARDLYKTVTYIIKDSLWSAMITAIYVNEQEEIELIPRLGNQRILLGNADSLDLKFRNLKAFYKQAIPQVGWDAYKIINVKYANQVIGVKNDHLKKDSTAISLAAKKDSSGLKRDTSKIKH